MKIDKASENSKEKIDSQKIYVSMAHMYTNAEVTRIYYGDSSQLTNYILYSGVTCHMTPNILDFIPGLLVQTDKYIVVADGHFVAKKNRIGSNKNV